MNSVHRYYKKLKLKDNFNLTLTMDEKVLKVCNVLTSQKQEELIKYWGDF